MRDEKRGLFSGKAVPGAGNGGWGEVEAWGS